MGSKTKEYVIECKGFYYHRNRIKKLKAEIKDLEAKLNQLK